MSKKWHNIKPLTQRELEELLPRESDDEQDSSGSENEDNLEEDFSLSDSEFECRSESTTDSDEGPLKK
jgi:hypothetical protein